MPGAEIYKEWAKTLAEKLVASGSAPPAGLSDDERLALAWALKDAAASSWNSMPRKTVVASDAINLLFETDSDQVASLPRSEVRAIAAWVRGFAELTNGGMTNAIKHFDSADARFRLIELHLSAAHTQIPKVFALSILGEYTEAVECGKAALSTFLAHNDRQAASRLSVNLGNMSSARSDHPAALKHYRQAADIFNEIGDHERYVSCQTGIANVHEATGNFSEALTIYEAVMKLARKHHLFFAQAVVEESVALLHLARGEYRKALAGMERARQQYEELQMTQNIAIAEKQLADTYLDLRLLPEALALFDRAIPRFQSLDMVVEAAWTNSQRGRALAGLGRPLEEITANLLQAAEIFSAQDIPAGKASVMLARSELALLHNDLESALALASDAADVFRSAQLLEGCHRANVIAAHALLRFGKTNEAGAKFAATLESARELQLRSVEVRCLVGLGLTARCGADIEGAQSAFESAIMAFEQQRSALPGDDIRSAFLADQLLPYQELLRIALFVHDDSHWTSQTAEVLIRLEQFRARALDERLGDFDERDSAADADGVEHDLRARLNWLHRRAEKLLNDGESNQALLDDARQIEFELLERARRRRLTATASGSSSEREALSASALQAALAHDDALVEYGVLDNELFACVVTNSGVALKRNVAKWTEVVEAIHTARFQIETLRNGAGELNKHLDLLTRRSQTALCRLHALIWAPLANLLVDCHRVFIVPHEHLGSVPFAALHDDERYLSQLYDIAVAPSARVALRGLGRLPVRPRHAVIVGESSRLLHAAEEAQFVASLFEEATVLMGQDACGDALRATCTQADVLHLACHGQFRSDNPMFSALHLVDGPFTVQDAEALRLPQGVVVLSACESGVATASKGDEVIGLVRAFLIAGAARVVASLWPVDDAVTTEFMAVFYASLRAGATPAAALRSAQLEVMKTHPHPFHWAAFTVHGGW